MRTMLLVAVTLMLAVPATASATETVPGSEVIMSASVLETPSSIELCVEDGLAVPCWRELIIAGATGIIAMATLAACVGTAVTPFPGDETFACLTSYGTTTLAGISLFDLIGCLSPNEEEEPLVEPSLVV